MITPIGALTINQICERKDDLLASNEDIKKVAKHVRESTIDEFAELAVTQLEDMGCSAWAIDIAKIAEQMKNRES